MSTPLLVSAFPNPNFKSLWRGKGSFSDVLSGYVGRFGSGTAAVYWAFRGLGLPQGSRVWMPEYNCGVEVQAAIDVGLHVGYYRITSELEVDEENLERKLRKHPGPVLLIHYFGFPQTGIERIAKLCRKLGCVLIEDCAHALFSSFNSTPLGTFAPLSVFSLRKSLPLYDGGALLMNQPLLGNILLPKPSVDAYKLLFKDTIRRIIGPHVTEAIRRWRDPGDEPENRRVAWESQSACYNKRLSLLSHRIASSAHPDAIVSARRSNWQTVHERFSEIPGHRPVWNKLPQGACPLFYCLWTRERDALMQRLFKTGVETFRFGARAHPSLDLSTCPESRIMRESILGFPVHQNIDKSSLQKALEIYRRI